MRGFFVFHKYVCQYSIVHENCTTLGNMTELQNAAKAAATRPRIQPAEEGDNRPLSVSARLGRLQFHHSGKFRVLQLTDIQDGPKVSKDTVKLIEASLDATRPDIVIFAGYDPAYAQTTRKRRWSASAETACETSSSKSSEVSERFEAALERTRTSVRATIEQLVHPLVDRSIPWAVTFGNHDFQCGLGNAEIESICREFPGCLNPDPTGDKSNICRANACLPASREHSRCRFPTWIVRRPCLAWYCWIQAIMHIPAGTEARPRRRCDSLPKCRE